MTLKERAKANALFLETKKRVLKGEKVTEACAATGFSTYAYYNRSKPNAAVNKLAPKKPSKLGVHDLPEMAIKQASLFMVYGSPELLAAFARGLS